LAQWCIDNVLTTRSNDPSGNGNEATSRRGTTAGARRRPRPDGVGPSALDHGRIEVETGHIEAVLASQPDRQVTRSAAHLKNPCAVRGDVV